MRELRVARSAEADLLEIWSYLFVDNEEAADRIIDEITEKYDLLREFPYTGRRRTELGVGYRSLVVGNYVIFYRVSDTTLEISRVLHGARDMVRLFSREAQRDNDGE